MATYAPLVSIVTPSFNQAQYLRQTLDSVLKQDYPHIEYLVVDGASTDGSVDIIKEYSNKLTWWVSEPDQGQADAINKGFRRARGEIVAWINSDDFYLPGAVSRMVNAFERYPKAGMIYGDIWSIGAKGNLIKDVRYKNWGLTGLMCFRIIGQPAVFMKREVLQQSGLLDPSYSVLLDHELWLRIGINAKMQYHPGAVAAARYHAQSKNAALGSQFGVEARKIATWLSEDMRFAKANKSIARKVWAGAECLAARYLLDDGKAQESFSAYMRSIAWHPAAAAREWKRVLFSLLARLGLVKIDWLPARKRMQ